MSIAMNMPAAPQNPLARDRIEKVSGRAARRADELRSMLQGVQSYVSIAREALPAESKPRQYLESAIEVAAKAKDLASLMIEDNRALVAECCGADAGETMIENRLPAVADRGDAQLSESLVALPEKTNPKTINLTRQIEKSLVELTSLAGDRLDSVFCADKPIPDPPSGVKDFIRRLSESEALDLTKSPATWSSATDLARLGLRATERVTCYTMVIAVPVDRKWVRVGDPFKLALRDVSEEGLRLVHSRATNAAYLALTWNATQLAGEQIRVVCAVKRCEAYGRFYDIGGQFLMAD